MYRRVVRYSFNQLTNKNRMPMQIRMRKSSVSLKWKEEKLIINQKKTKQKNV
jgi:stress response protein YsnF